LLSFSRLWPTFRTNGTKRRDSISNFFFTAFPNLPATFRANKTKRRNAIDNFSFTTRPKKLAIPMPTSLPRKHRLVSGLLCRIYLQLCIAGRHVVRCPECWRRDRNARARGRVQGRRSAVKMFAIIRLVGHPKANAATK
jgi:hypothetical protein